MARKMDRRAESLPHIDWSKVKLFGHVTRLALKGAVEEAVKSIAGVTSVDSEIEVLRPSPMDDRIRLAVYQAIYSRESLQKHQLGADGADPHYHGGR